MNLQRKIIDSLEKNKSRIAFHISENSYTYDDLAILITKIRYTIRENTGINNKHIGLIISDTIETYASIFACWLEGKAYVPISPLTPIERNKKVINQADISIFLSASDDNIDFNDYMVICTANLPLIDKKQIEPILHDSKSTDLAYIFFTSGTTGVPKGVPITYMNLLGFCDAFSAMECTLENDDRCLQMFELTFDLSVMSYLIPILKGASVYTVPKEVIKYSYIFKLMQEKRLTFALMVPSILYYLRPYFNEINCPDMKYSLFCGESLPLNIVEEWSNCVSNSKILNVYGPTEDTIFCTEYVYKKGLSNKAHNGILSIGKPMKNATIIVIDENKKEVKTGKSGELCLAGAQLTPGYWKNQEKNESSFFMLEYNGVPTRFYRTGDLCLKDEDGDIMYSGRIDFQVKVQGFRVELSEIELYAKEAVKKRNAIAVAFSNSLGNTEIGLILEGGEIEILPIIEYLKSKIPPYMVPSKIKFIDNFPLNINGKTDRNKLSEQFM